MSETPVDEMAVRRFNKTSDPNDLAPMTAIEAAKEWLLGEGRDVDHVIILTGRTTEGGSSAHHFFQAGSYKGHAQFGLLFAGQQMLWENG